MPDIAVIDCQASWEVYTDRFRELFEDAEVYFAPEGEFPEDPDKVIITGSTSDISCRKDWMEDLIERTRDYIESGIPVLGICFGLHTVVEAMGGNVRPMDDWEIGYVPVEFDNSEHLIGTEYPFSVHREEVVSVPEELNVTARSEKSIQAVEHSSKSVYGVQFHPELTPEICRKSISSKDIEKERKDRLMESVNQQNFDRARRCLKIIEDFKSIPVRQDRNVRELVDAETVEKI